MKTRILTFLLAITASIGITYADMERVLIGDLYYNLKNDQTAEVTYKSLTEPYTLTDVSIPASVTYNGTTYTVTRIGPVAFSTSQTLTHVTIPNTVTYIGRSAFDICYRLKSITIPNSVTYIGDGAFQSCNSLPVVNNIRYAGPYLVKAIDTLKTYSIRKGTKWIGSGAFSSSRITSIAIPNSVIAIGNAAFYGCESLTSISLPNSVTRIDDNAFSNCSNLQSITIPSSVLFMGDNVFDRCHKLPVIDNVRYAGPYVVEAADNMISSCSIIEGTKWIGNDAFKNCTNLTSVTFPNTLRQIQDFAFANSGLTSVVIPNSVDTLDYECFSDCKQLKYVSVGENVSCFSWVFNGCNSIEEIVWNAINVDYVDCGTSSVSTFHESANTLKSITFGNKVQFIPGPICADMPHIKRVDIPNSVYSMGGDAFHNCTGLKVLSIGKNVKDGIGFGGCAALDTVYNHSAIPQSLTSACFAGVNKPQCLLIVPKESKYLYKTADVWKEFKFEPDEECIGGYGKCGNNLAWILSCDSTVLQIKGTGELNDYSAGKAPWYGACDSIKTIILPDGLTTIGNYAFYNCHRVSKIRIPSSVTISKTNAFSGCNSLQGVYIEDLTAWCQIYFYDMDANPLTYAQRLYLNKNEVTDLVIPDGITHIQHYAFMGCKNISSLSLPESLQFIGYAAFYNTGIVSVNIPQNVTTIVDLAFGACLSLESVNVDENNQNYCSSGGVLFDKDTTTLILYPAKKEEKTYIIPKHVKEISTIAFYCNDFLTTVHMPDSMEVINRSNFQNCNSLTSLGIPEGITELSNVAYQCTNLKSLQLPQSLKRLYYTGAYCAKLESITIPANVTTIEYASFYGCSGLQQIVCEAMAPPACGEFVFGKVDKSIPLKVPVGSWNKYRHADVWKEFTSIQDNLTPATTVDAESLQTTVTDNSVTITWLYDVEAESYIIVLKQGETTLCTLNFDNLGNLLGIQYAPSRYGSHQSNMATLTTKGWQYTIGGLEADTQYTFSVTTKKQDKSETTLYGSFTTQQMPTALDEIGDSQVPSLPKIMRNGQLFILRDRKMFTITGAEVK